MFHMLGFYMILVFMYYSKRSSWESKSWTRKLKFNHNQHLVHCGFFYWDGIIRSCLAVDIPLGLLSFIQPFYILLVPTFLPLFLSPLFFVSCLHTLFSLQALFCWPFNQRKHHTHVFLFIKICILVGAIFFVITEYLSFFFFFALRIIDGLYWDL